MFDTEIHSAAPDSTSDGQKIGSPSVTSHTTPDKHSNKQHEDAKIAELLNRGDTAVIYPEPVSDGEEQQNGDGKLLTIFWPTFFYSTSSFVLLFMLCFILKYFVFVVKLNYLLHYTQEKLFFSEILKIIN